MESTGRFYVVLIRSGRASAGSGERRTRIVLLRRDDEEAEERAPAEGAQKEPLVLIEI